MTQTSTHIWGGAFNYARLHDVMLALMCWNWDFEVDTCSGVITIPGRSRADFIIAATKDRGELLPADLYFRLGKSSDMVVLEVENE